MPREFMDKVQYLCRQIKEVEWSGVLFYKLEGTMNNPSKAKIVLKDIFLMDRGSKTLTEYDFGKDPESALDIVDLMMTKPEYKHYQKGLIHSHNTMQVFFSSTDQEELIRSSEFYNFYLSLIVNSFMEFTAKVAFRGKAKISSNFTAINEKGKEYKLSNPVKEKTTVYTYDTVIYDPVNISTEFAQRADKIMKAADERDKKIEKQRLSSLPKIVQNGKGNFKTESDYINSFLEKGGGFIQEGLLGMEEDVINLEIEPKYMEFATFLLRLGNTQTNSVGIDEIEDALEDCSINGVTEQMPLAVINQFIDLHTKFFSETEPEAETLEFILNSLEQIIAVYEDYEDSYVWLSNLILALKSFGNKLAK